MLTAKSSGNPDYEKKLMQYYVGASTDRDRYLMKPFNPEELAHLVERLLGIPSKCE